MSNVIGSMFVTLGLNSATFENGLKSAQGRLKGFANFAQTALFGATAAAAGGIASLGIAIAHTSGEIASLRAEARTAGVAFEEFQRLKYAAEKNLVSIEALTDGLKEMNLRADEFVVTGAGSAAEAFARIGFTADDLREKLQRPSDLFTEIIGKLSQLDRAAQIRIADEIFGGTGGEQFVRLLGEGASGIERLKREADQLGLVLSERAGTAAEKFSQSMRRISDIFRGLFTRIMEAVLPALDQLADTLNSPQFADGAVAIAQAIVDAFDLAAQAIGRVGEALMRIGPLAQRPLNVLQEQLASKKAVLEADGWIWDKDKLMREISELEIEIARRLDPSNFNVSGVFAGLNNPQMFVGSQAAFFDSLRTPTATAGVTSAGQALNDLGSSAAAANSEVVDLTEGGLAPLETQVNSLADTLRYSLQSAFTEPFVALGQALRSGENAWDSFANAGLDALGRLSDQMMQMATSQIFNMIFGAVFGAPTMGAGLGGGSFAALGTGIGFGSYGLPGFADGTNFHSGGLAIVGERGPEIVSLPRGAGVIPAADLGRGASGGKTQIEVTVSDLLEVRMTEISEGVLVRGLRDYGRTRLRDDMRRINRDPMMRRN
ncbi:MAG: phage tail tape measure protein [Hyphomicrobiaceae bacterium]|nr:phage tail tape measure protein [Hyphomicrobiaceae bacterium]